MTLTPTDQAILDALSQYPNPQSPQAQASLYSQFGSLTRVWQLVNALLDTEEALAYSPRVVTHLRRVRQARRDLRARSWNARSGSARHGFT